MRLYLTGFMATGKTTVGRALAREMDVPFVDLDSEIEDRTGKTVRQLFAAEGEAFFRQLEQKALTATLESRDLVVATGGGTLVDSDNRRRIEGEGLTVWLDLPFDVILERLGPESRRARPLFGDLSTARTLFEARRDAYSKSDIRLRLSGRESPVQVVASILRELEGGPCAT